MRSQKLSQIETVLLVFKVLYKEGKIKFKIPKPIMQMICLNGFTFSETQKQVIEILDIMLRKCYDHANKNTVAQIVTMNPNTLFWEADYTITNHGENISVKLSPIKLANNYYGFYKKLGFLELFCNATEQSEDDCLHMDSGSIEEKKSLTDFFETEIAKKSERLSKFKAIQLIEKKIKKQGYTFHDIAQNNQNQDDDSSSEFRSEPQDVNNYDENEIAYNRSQEDSNNSNNTNNPEVEKSKKCHIF